MGTPAVPAPCTASTQPPAAPSLPSHPYRLHSLQDRKQPGSPCAAGQSCARHPQTAQPGSRSPAAREKGHRTAERCRNSAVICRGSDQPPPRAPGQPARRRMDLGGRAGVSWHLLSATTQAFPRCAMQQTPWHNSHPLLQTQAPKQQKREGKGSLLQLSTAGAFLGTEQQSTAEKARQDRASAQGERGEGSQGSGQGRAAHPHCAPALCTRIPPAAQGPAQRQRFVCQAVRWKPSRSSV